MIKRGLFYCAEEVCCLGPEFWRDGFGLCLKHAVTHDWIAETPTIKRILSPKTKDFLDRLLEGFKNGNVDDVLDETFPRMARRNFPSGEPKPHWSEYQEYPF